MKADERDVFLRYVSLSLSPGDSAWASKVRVTRFCPTFAELVRIKSTIFQLFSGIIRSNVQKILGP